MMGNDELKGLKRKLSMRELVTLWRIIWDWRI
jgi:hypothetical protein